MIVNMKNLNKILLLVLTTLLSALTCSAQSEGKWVLNNAEEPAPGYIKFNTTAIKHFSLWDNYGLQQYTATPYPELKLSNYRLLKNGLWIALGNPGPSKYKYYLLSQDLEMVDSIPLSTKYKVDIHDMELMSNGNYLILYTYPVIVDMSKLVDGGFHSARITTSVIVETDKDGNSVWEWKSADHLNILDATSDIDLTQISIDFPHANSFFEDSDGNIIVSFRHLDEIVKINKTTSEFIWRLGGGRSKNNQFTFINDEDENGFAGFSHQHSVSMLQNGNLLLYDNGNMKPLAYSRAVEYQLDVAGKTATKVWEYRNQPDIYVSSMGSTFRLENGNTLINWGLNRIIEVTKQKKVVYDLQYFPSDNRDLAIYRAYKNVTKMDAVTKLINSPGNYSFAGGEFNTGLDFNVSSLNGTSNITVVKHYYIPPSGSYSDSGFTAILPRRWVITSTNEISEISGSLKFVIGDIESAKNHSKFEVFKRDREGKGIFKKIPSSYSNTAKEVVAEYGGTGEYVICVFDLGQPLVKNPIDGSDAVPLTGSIRWDSLPGAREYQYQISNTDNFEELILDSVVNVLNGPYYGLNYNIKYYCRIRAFNSADTSDWSQAVSFTTLEVPRVNLVFPDDNYKNLKKKDTLIWSGVDGISAYWVQFSTEISFSGEIISISVNNTKLNPSGLLPLTEYYWRVRAYSGTNTGDWSEVRSFTTGLYPPNLKTPANQSGNITKEGILIWLRVPGVTVYQAEISEFADFHILAAEGKEIKDTAFEYKGLKTLKEYFWHVRSVTLSDTSEWSDTYLFSTKADFELDTPGLVSPADSVYGVPVEGIIDWDDVSNAKFYRAAISNDYELNDILINKTGLPETELEYSELEYNHRYFWGVIAFNDSASSNWSRIWSFTTELKAPEGRYPQDNALNQPPTGSIGWTSSGGAGLYRLQISENEGFSGNLEEQEIENDTSFKYNLKPTTKYYWRIKAESMLNSSRWSIANSFVTGPPTAVMEIPGYDDISIYPIPAFDILYISNSQYRGYTFQVYSMEGTVVTGGILYENQISVSQLAMGSYYLRIGNFFYMFSIIR